MESFTRSRTTSIPHDYHSMAPQDDDFDDVAAGALILKLRTIDGLLCSTPIGRHRQLDLTAIVQSDATMQAIADTDTAQDLQILVRHLHRPELIAATFVELYTTALHGRIYCNVYRCEDDLLGPDPTCSEVLGLLPAVDQLLDTSLREYFDAVNDQGM